VYTASFSRHTPLIRILFYMRDDDIYYKWCSLPSHENGCRRTDRWQARFCPDNDGDGRSCNSLSHDRHGNANHMCGMRRMTHRTFHGDGFWHNWLMNQNNEHDHKASSTPLFFDLSGKLPKDYLLQNMLFMANG
jgi:hypothetical protein